MKTGLQIFEINYFGVPAQGQAPSGFTFQSFLPDASEEFHCASWPAKKDFPVRTSARAGTDGGTGGHFNPCPTLSFRRASRGLAQILGILRQGCKGFSSFVRFFSEQKTVAKRSPAQPARAPKMESRIYQIAMVNPVKVLLVLFKSDFKHMTSRLKSF